MVDGSPVTAPMTQMIHSLPFTHPARVYVDLHWHVFEECCRDDDDDALWAASAPVSIGGAATRILAPEDQLIHACVHGEKWVRVPGIRWVADAVVVVRGGQVRWDRLVQQAVKRRFVLRLRAQLAYLPSIFRRRFRRRRSRCWPPRPFRVWSGSSSAGACATGGGPGSRLLVQPRPVGARGVRDRRAHVPAVHAGDLAPGVPGAAAGSGRRAAHPIGIRPAAGAARDETGVGPGDPSALAAPEGPGRGARARRYRRRRTPARASCTANTRRLLLCGSSGTKNSPARCRSSCLVYPTSSSPSSNRTLTLRVPEAAAGRGPSTRHARGSRRRSGRRRAP